MAPPTNRRSGNSRRAQYTTFFGYVAGLVGAGIGVGLLAISLADPSAFGALRGLGGDAAVPASRVADAGKRGSEGLYEGLRGYLAAGRQNAHLQRELKAAKVRLVEAKALADENRRLKALLNLAEADRRPVAMARLVNSTSSSLRRFATLSAGSSRGVQIGMPVRSPLGLVGRVVETGSISARVLLITDPESVVPVRRARDGVSAFAQGRSDGLLNVRLINLGINPLKPGDTFVTSGSGGLYWPGVAVAVVTAVTRDGAIARVLSDPSATDFVAVEPVWSPVEEPTGAPEGAPAAATPPAGTPGAGK